MPSTDVEEQARFLKDAYSYNELRSKTADRVLDLPPNPTKDELARALARYKADANRRDRRGEDVNTVAELRVGDRLRNRWSQKMTVERIERPASRTPGTAADPRRPARSSSSPTRTWPG